MGVGIASEPAARPAAAPAPPAAHYRPQLDGLRAVAVYLVVAYHAGIPVFSGGFIGVDLFFVLSGYLVTQLLLRDFRTSDRVGFRRFYARRFRRLLPAAFVTLIVTAIVYTAVAAPVDVVAARGGFRASFLYVANWHFIAQSNDYFGADVNNSPVLHFWSLAVEEQFYLVWPLLLSGIYLFARRFGDRRWQVVRIVMLAGFLLSLGAALHLSDIDLNRAYYGTDTRAYELLAGGLLAITPRVVRSAKQRAAAMGVLAAVALAALVFVATSHVHLGAIQRGLAATIVSAALIVALEASRAGWVGRTLSTPSAVYLGRVSYGTYLWHWPVIVIATQRFSPSPWALFALTCLIATGIASLSFQVLEQRVRLSRALDRHRTAVIATGLAVSLVGGLVLIPAIMRDRGTGSSSARGIGVVANGADTRVPVPRGLDLQAAANAPYGRPDCYKAPVQRCIVSGREGPLILLIGDSHAQSLIRGFQGVARKHGMRLAIVTSPNCPWELGAVQLPIGSPPDLARVCRAHQTDWYERVVPQLQPAVVVLAHRTLDDPITPGVVGFIGTPPIRAGQPGFQERIEDATDQAIATLRADGRKIVIVEPLPTASGTFNPYTCLSTATYLDECRYVAVAQPTPLEQYFRSVADGRDVYSIDLDPLVCPYLPICDPIVGGVVVKKDPQHITAPFSGAMTDAIDRLLVEDRIIER
jgi:peptidoglycan/LPS O-acetylase OafA/YrhL